MDEQSKVSVSKLDANNISLTVLNGSALVFAETQKRGQTLELRIGNASMGVRGTLFVIGHGSGDAAIITMLDGSGVVGDTSLTAGSVMRIYEDNDRQELVVSDMDIEDMDLFTLEAIRDYRELLLDTGVLSPDMLEDVSALIDNLLREREASRPAVSDARLRRDAAREAARNRNPSTSGNTGRSSNQSDMPEGSGQGHVTGDMMDGSDLLDDIMNMIMPNHETPTPRPQEPAGAHSSTSWGNDDMTSSINTHNLNN
jgi:hypothetical protein